MVIIQLHTGDKGMRIKNYRGAGVMLFRYNTRFRRFEVLLGKRSIPRGYGKWAIPGGGMENYDADYADCAFREFREETGIDIKNLMTQKLAVKRIDVPFYHWRTYMVLTWGYIPDFKPCEFSELRWFPILTVSKQDLWFSINHELKAFNNLVKKHELVIAYHTGMPVVDENLLTAYRHLTHMKLHTPWDVESYLFKHMDVGSLEIKRLCRKLEHYYKEDVS